MKDYGPQYQKGSGTRQNAIRRDGGRGQAGSAWLWRASGVLAIVTVAIGMGFSLWMGYRINAGLDELTAWQHRRAEMEERHERLQQQRDSLLAAEKFQAAARKVGLYPPAPEQVKRM
ncbi:MAG: hypothetical protein M0017_11900 [Desulfobacteraceae bacterium]|nr:hypothetical protein [Desulfobacteraceae bacterium]